MKNKKKKIAAVALLIALLAMGVVSGTMAYFQDTKSATNTFTFGKGISISLTETSTADASKGILAGVAYDTNKKLETEQGYDAAKKAGYKFTTILPGQVYSKKPTVSVDSESGECWLIATVTVDNYKLIDAIYKNETITATSVRQNWGYSLAGNGKLVSGGVADYTVDTSVNSYTFGNTTLYGTMLKKDSKNFAFITYSDVKSTDSNNGSITYTFYFLDKQTAGKSYDLFDTVTIPSAITQNMDGLKDGFNITVNAYAVQTGGFDNVYAAYTTAFASK